MPEKTEHNDVIADLKGTALRVFLYALKLGTNIKVRETARTLKFKSPGQAQYHLQRLYHLGLLEKEDDNTYSLAKRYSNLRSLKISILSEVYLFKGIIIPSLGLLSGFVLINILFSLIFYWLLSPTIAFINAMVGGIVVFVFSLIRSIEIIRSFLK